MSEGRVVLHPGPPPHQCHPPRSIGKKKETAPRSPFATQGEPSATWYRDIEPPVGMVWECECGRTFVAVPYQQRYSNCYVFQTSEWKPEGRWARRRRLKAHS